VENFPHQHTETVDVHLRSEINHFLLLGEDFGRRPNWARPVSPELIGIHFDIFELESVELHLPLALLGIVRNKDVMRGQAAVRHLHLLQRVKRINNLRNLAEQLKLLKCFSHLWLIRAERRAKSRSGHLTDFRCHSSRESVRTSFSFVIRKYGSSSFHSGGSPSGKESVC
jgi:hypothetical protein